MHREVLASTAFVSWHDSMISFETLHNPTRVEVRVPALNQGRFRLKRRDNAFSFGHSFAARSKEFSDDVYMEGRIGCDATLADIRNGTKHTSLGHLEFTGDNGKKKSPFELSELLSAAMDSGLVGREAVGDLFRAIPGIATFLDDRRITVGALNAICINGVEFQQTSIELPTYFMPWAQCGMQIEVSVQKQQYAAGVRPMVYLCIPIETFKNGRSFIGRTASRGEVLELEFDTTEAQVLVALLQVFSLCSRAHSHDVREILDVIMSN